MQFASRTKPVQKKVPVLVEEVSDTSRGRPKSTTQPSPTISPRTSTNSLERSDLTSQNLSPVPLTKTRVASSSLSSHEGSSLKTGNVSGNRTDTGSSVSGAEKPSSNPFSRPASATKVPGTLTEPATSKVAPSGQPSSSDEILAWSRRLDASRPPSTEPSLTQQLKVEEPLHQVRLYLL